MINSCSSITTTSKTDDKIQSVSKVINQQIAEKYIKTVLISVKDKDRLEYLKFSDVENNYGVNTLFRIGSITKVFTGIMLAYLVVDGKVALSDKLKKYVPYLVNVPAGEITLLELATHTAGLGTGYENYSKSRTKDDFKKLSNLDKFKYTLIDFNWKKTTKVRYSNFGMGALGYILGVVTDKSYEQLLEEVILIPLNMQQTTISKLKGRKIAQGHNIFLEPMTRAKLGPLQGMGAIYSTITDMNKFLKANMYPESISSKYNSLKKAVFLAQTKFAKKKTGYMGLGWQILNEEGTEYAHGGSTDGFKSVIRFNKEDRIGHAYLSNVMTRIRCIDKFLYTNENCDIFENEKLSTQDLSKFEGFYSNSESEYTIRVWRVGRRLAYEFHDKVKGYFYYESDSNFSIKRIAKVEFSETFLTFTYGKINLKLIKQ